MAAGFSFPAGALSNADGRAAVAIVCAEIGHASAGIEELLFPSAFLFAPKRGKDWS
jgi:hypothetical protein